VKSELERRTAARLEAGGRVLLTRLQHLGDVVLTLPAVHALKSRFPEAEIDYLARSTGAEILAGEPIFSRVFRVPEKDEGVKAAWRIIRDLRGRGYVAAVDFYSNPRSALLTWASGAKLRVGGARPGRRRLFTHAIHVPGDVRSAIEHHLCYVRPLDVDAAPAKPVLHVTRDERERARARLQNAGVPQGPQKTVGLHPGAKWEVKRWPVEFFADLARRLVETHDLRVVVLTGPGEESDQAALRALAGSNVSTLAALPVREAAAVVATLDGMVVSDGGMMHVSVAVGTPTVGLFGSSEPDIWFPYEAWGPFVPAYTPIECRPCHLHTCDHLSCLRLLTSDAVEEKLLGVMKEGRRSEYGISR
jgi:lipopolysaccharide heptosyltransferase II